MKNLCLTAATIAAAALLFSCEQQEQSVFNPESLPGTAVITGTVTYDEGSATFEYNEDGVIAEHIIPAAGQIAVLTIPYSEYNPSSEGNQVFTDTIGADGTYEFVVPVGSTELQGTVNVIPFRAAKNFFINKQLAVVENALYEAYDEDVVLRDQFTQTVDITAHSTIRPEVEWNFDKTLTCHFEGPGFNSVNNSTGFTYEPTYETPVDGIIFDIVVTFTDSYGETTVVRYPNLETYGGEFEQTLTFPDDAFSTGAYTTREYYVEITTPMLRNIEYYYQVLYAGNTAPQWMSEDVTVVYETIQYSTNNIDDSWQLDEIEKHLYLKVPTRPLDIEEVPGLGYEIDSELGQGGTVIFNYDPVSVFQW